MYKTKLMLLVLAATVIALPAMSQQHNSNSEVTARIQDKLFHANIFKHGDVRVTFNNGVATLTGAVDSVGVKMDAVRAAREVDDVNQVVDNIRVDTDDTSYRQILQEARRKILTYYAYTIFDWVTLEAKGNVLILNGEVTQPYKKSDIGYYLSHIKGVTGLENDLEVLPVSDYDDELRIEVARAIYNDPYFINYADQANPPIHIIVKNGNVTLEGVVASEEDRTKAAMDAQLAGTFFAFKNDLRVEQM